MELSEGQYRVEKIRLAELVVNKVVELINVAIASIKADDAGQKRAK